jgi:hypothetical protein
LYIFGHVTVLIDHVLAVTVAHEGHERTAQCRAGMVETIAAHQAGERRGIKFDPVFIGDEEPAKRHGDIAQLAHPVSGIVLPDAVTMSVSYSSPNVASVK